MKNEMKKIDSIAITIMRGLLFIYLGIGLGLLLGIIMAIIILCVKCYYSFLAYNSRTTLTVD